MRRAIYFTILLLLATTIGCKGGDVTSATKKRVIAAPSRSYEGVLPPFEGKSAVERFAYDLAKAECEAMFACLPAANASYGLSDFQATTVGECMRSHLDRQSPARLAAAVAQSRSAFDPSAAAHCLNDIKAMSCSSISTVELDPFTYLASCSQALAGKAAKGDRCGGSWDCAGGLMCDTSFGPCQGQCQPTSAGQILCGQAPCGLDQFCDMRSQTCKPLLGEGERCLDSSQCADGRECASPGGSSPSVCASTTLVAAGSSCDVLHLCAPGTVCGASSTCVRVADKGGSCAGGGTPQCAYGLYCAGGQCVPRRDNGACQSDEECRS
ncbi:MAG TPA: hypothetical protein VKA53_11225, partial [Thermoanaerobaculia bacterium]|nr:hypothetical protein [Thermoanaerobaculia bacterium]